MRLPIFDHLAAFAITSLAAVAAAQAAPECSADNCLRAVRASKSLAQRVADCSSFLLHTVTPAAVTLTDTITNTATVSTTDVTVTTTTTTSTITTTIVFGPAENKRRQVTVSPTAIPAYASPCAGAARYSSACSCLGVTKSTITVAAPSTTVTEVAATPITETKTVSGTTVVTVTTTTKTTAYSCGPNAPTQIVENPSFEFGREPWFIFSTGNAYSQRENGCGRANSFPETDCRIGALCSCVFVNANPPGGAVRVFQDVAFACTARAYTFVAYLGISNNGDPNSEVNTMVTATLDGVEIFPPFLPCGNPNTQCGLNGGGGPYVKVGPITVYPTRPNPRLEFLFNIRNAPGRFSRNVYLDDITLTLQP